MGETKHKGLLLRVASALLLAPLVLFTIAYGDWPFAVLMALGAGLAIFEWLHMSRLAQYPMLNFIPGLVYIFVCFAAIVQLRLGMSDGAGLTLALLLSVWASDIGAYFTGKAVGGPKMAPVISPNKTWAGLVGGMAASTAVFALYIFYFGPWLSSVTGWNVAAAQTTPLAVVLLLGASITLSGQAGDLLVSMEKRKVGVKDTGNIIPGHGGVLDRIDALLLAALVFLLCVKSLGL